MYKIPLADIKEKIRQSGQLGSEELERRIKDKINELSGLISEEGAAHIIANELGVELFNLSQSRLKIKEVYAGMRDVSTLGKVMHKFEVREFAKEGRTGKVCSLIIGDETGTIRLVFWNEQVDQLQQISEGDIVLAKDAYARENNNDRELHLGNRGTVQVNPPGESIGFVRQRSTFQRKGIAELGEGEEGVEIMGTVVQVFDPRFFSVCPRCNRRLMEVEGTFRCSDHGEVPGELSYVINTVLDDGTGTIRAVFWKNQANHLLGKGEKEVASYQENPASFEGIKNDLLGEQFKLMGRVKRNEIFDRLEFSVQLVGKADPREEIERLEKN